jgi:hypothetical protein
MKEETKKDQVIRLAKFITRNMKTLQSYLVGKVKKNVEYLLKNYHQLMQKQC